MSYEKLEKSLYEVLESNTELVKLNKKLLAYNKSDIEPVYRLKELLLCNRLQTTLEKNKNRLVRI